MARIRVFLADDHPLYRAGLIAQWQTHPILDVVGEADSGEQALALVVELQPDIMIIDLKLPDIDGVELLRQVKQTGFTGKAVILSAYVDRAAVYEAFASGARAYLEKGSSTAEITQSIERVCAGEFLIPSALQEGLVAEIKQRESAPAKPTLSAREIEVLKLAADGKSTQQIATALFISVSTVKTHLQHIYEKCGVSDRAAAVAFALRGGILR